MADRQETIKLIRLLGNTIYLTNNVIEYPDMENMGNMGNISFNEVISMFSSSNMLNLLSISRQNVYIDHDLFVKTLNIALKDEFIITDVRYLEYVEKINTIQHGNIKIPREIFLLNNLVHLHISGCILPDNLDLSGIRNVVDLKISGSIMGRIPDSLVNLDKLEYLTLSHNLITIIPSGIFAKSLIVLDLDSNPIDKLPDDICDLPFLRSIMINHTGIENLSKKFLKLRGKCNIMFCNTPLAFNYNEHMKSLTGVDKYEYIYTSDHAEFPNML